MQGTKRHRSMVLIEPVSLQTLAAARVAVGELPELYGPQRCAGHKSGVRARREGHAHAAEPKHYRATQSESRLT